MEKQTAVDYLVSKISGTRYQDIKQVINEAKEIEKQRIKEAIMYALDEDGHTGEWKIKFANDYINKYYENPTHI